MKRHLVVICGVLYPRPSPTGLITERYVNLVKDDYDIEYICISVNGLSECIKKEDNIVIHTLTKNCCRLERKFKLCIGNTIIMIEKFLIKLNRFGSLFWYIKAATRKLEEINNNRNIDAILTICSPFVAHWVGINYKKKHPHINLCAYTVDPYSTKDRIRPLFWNFSNLVKLEMKTFELVDSLLLSEEVFEHRKELHKNVSKCHALPYLLPPFIKANSTNYRFDPLSVNCVYAGSFYHDIRNPDYMLSIFSKLKNKKIILHLFSSGCKNIISKYADMKTIIIHPIVSHSEMIEIYASADILIGLGNSVEEFLPSKTFEYIASRKPIVYFNCGNIKNKVLESYPYSLQLTDKEDITLNRDMLETFCIGYKGYIADKDDILQLYKSNTEDNIKAILKEYIA